MAPSRAKVYPRPEMPLTKTTDAKNETSQPHQELSAISQADLQNRAKLAAKLCSVMKVCAVVPKDKSNAQQHYKYASSDAILEKVNPALVGVGLATVCSLEILDRQPRTTGAGAIWELVTVRARITIIDTATGTSIESEGIGQGYDGGDKSLSKAQTQARKYAWLLALNISTGDDPEADERTDRSLEPMVKCRFCQGPANYIDDTEYEGVPCRVYYCEKCKKETRIKVAECLTKN